MSPAERKICQAASELVQTYNSMPDRWNEIPKPIQEKIAALQLSLEDYVKGAA